MLLTLTQALQLVGVTPSLFVIFFLLMLSVRNRQAIIPIFYFTALICSFSIPLLEIYPPQLRNHWVEAGLMLGEGTLTAFSFLLICQFIMGRVPSFSYWLILTIPLVGGGLLLHANMLQEGNSCAKDQACLDVLAVKSLYQVFSSAAIFLLLVYYISRSGKLHEEYTARRHKYWLIIALVMLHLLVLAVDLAHLSGHFTPDQALLASTMLKLTFIYLVLTSFFRVFHPGFASRASEDAEDAYDPALDLPQVDKIKTLLERECAYRQMRLNRAKLAELVGITEYQLSRIINRHFGMNFNELVNGYRIEEAKSRLKSEASQQITVIGFEVGFNSIASFNRVFKTKVGLSPTEYRNKA